MWLQNVFALLITMCGSTLALCQLDLYDVEYPSYKVMCQNTTFDDYAYDIVKLYYQHGGEPTTEEGRILEMEFSIVNSDLPVIDGFFNGSYVFVYLAYTVKINLCHVTTITKNTFTELTNMQNLDLAFNEIDDVRFISGLPSNVYQLSLKNNKVSSINFSLFNHPLDTLDLSFNRIKEIDFSTVKYLPVTQTLNLENNHIITVYMGPALDDAHYIEINLANNPLQHVKNCEMHLHQSSIGSLNLSNSLTYIPLQNIAQCKINFANLIVNNNNLTLDSSIDFFDKAANLDYSNSSISHIPRHMFENRIFYGTLNLSFNNFELFSDSVFSNSFMVYLDLSNCKIKTVDKWFENMSADSINLTANFISELNSSSFNKLIYVHDLNLSFNNLTLKNNSFVNCHNLNELRLDNSNISIIKAGAFNGLTSLEKLSLQSNPLQSFPSDIFTPLISIKKIYLQNNRLAILRSNDFSSIPIRFVKLGGNNIELIEHRAFYNLSWLENIEIKNNNASMIIEEHAFSDLPSLHKVNLSNSGINRTNLNMFHDTLKLQIIDMRNNNITIINFSHQENVYLKELHLTVLGDLKSKSLMGLKFLRNLTLWNSKIKTIKTRAFQNLFKLSRLEIKNSEIELLEDGAFDSLFELQYMDLDNMFRHEGRLKSLTFQDLGFLKQLNLSHQGLRDIAPNAFKGLNNLECLNLNNNSLHHLKDSTFAGLQKLQVLNISYNRLTFLERDTFRELSALTTLNLNNNNLNNLELGLFQHLPNMKSLNLKGNNLSEFNIGTFSNLYNLEILDLAENSISDLKFESFLVLKSLNYLNLEYNNLKTFGRYNLTSNLENVRRLGIAHNKWPCEYLEEMLLSFRNSNINYSSSSINFYDDNVEGIECIDVCKYLLCLKDSHGIN